MLNQRSPRAIMAQIIKQIICIGMTLVVILPILLTVFAALKTRGDMVNTSPLLLPPLDRITLENFETVLGNKYLWIGFKNTLIILAVSLIFNVLLGTITAYIIERFNFRGKKIVVGLFFAGMLVPTFVTEIARFKIINSLGLYNTLGAPIVIYIASDLMQLYIYRQFISTSPRPWMRAPCWTAAITSSCSGGSSSRCWPPPRRRWVIIKAITIINDMYIPYLYMPKNKLRTLTTFLMDYANAQQVPGRACGRHRHHHAAHHPHLRFLPALYPAGVAAGAVKE